MSAIEVVLLGTGSPLPDPERAGPSTLVRAGGLELLVDCGRGVLIRAAAVGSGAGRFDALLVTHLHSDHLTDLGDVLTTRWVTSFAPSPLAVAGPPGTGTVVAHVLEALEPDVGYRLAHHDDLTWRPDPEVTEHREGTVLERDGVTVTAAPTDHRPVSPSIGFRIDHGSHAVVVAGDTVPCAGLDRLSAGADALVHTVIRGDLIGAVTVQRLRDVLDYHSTVEQAARTAARAGVATLVLTHCVPAIGLGGGTEEEWRALAGKEFGGEVVVGPDLTSVPIG